MYGNVSIRSPHRSKGRRGGLRLNGCTEMFQSAPLTEARGDYSWAHERRASHSFQSAPLTEARGDAIRFTPAAGSIDVSIRSPHRSKGRPRTRVGSSTKSAVSIRSPHRSKGRLCYTWQLLSFRRFQSAPLTEARGDAGYCNQRNTKRLREWMREPPSICILLPKREHIPRCNLLLAIKLSTARKQAQNALTSLSRTLYSNPK